MGLVFSCILTISFTWYTQTIDIQKDHFVIAGVLSTLLITIFYLLPLLFVPIFVFNSCSAFCSFNHIFFSFLGILVILPFKKILVVAVEFAIYLYLIQVHFQITQHNFMNNVCCNNKTIPIPPFYQLCHCLSFYLHINMYVHIINTLLELLS